MKLGAKKITDYKKFWDPEKERICYEGVWYGWGPTRIFSKAPGLAGYYLGKLDDLELEDIGTLTEDEFAKLLKKDTHVYKDGEVFPKSSIGRGNRR